MVEKTPREVEIVKLISDLTKELTALKGEKIVLCGYCYYIDEGNREEHMKNSPHCHDMAYPCPSTFYKRGISFADDGRAIIDWELQ